MAEFEHLEKLRQGKESWQAWRKTNPCIRPDLSEADLNWSDLEGMDLSFANLRAVNLSESDLRGTDLFAANLSQANLARTDLTKANLKLSNMTCANLSRAGLIGADLGKADFSGANLTETDCTRANLEFALLSQATLHKTKFDGANLKGADLRSAVLRGASLRFVNLESVDLKGTEFDKTVLNRTSFVNTSFREVKGLETCTHEGPSFLDYHTIAEGLFIPKSFLRGCGLSDSFIEYIPALFQAPINHQSCFISHSSKDAEFADRLSTDLQNNGVRCWFSRHDMRGGEQIVAQIDRAIQLHDRLLLILSEHSIKSGWVETEILKAMKRQDSEKRQVLFPVTLVPINVIAAWECIDHDSGRDLARHIRSYYLPDFTKWKHHDSYQAELRRLLNDLATASKVFSADGATPKQTAGL